MYNYSNNFNKNGISKVKGISVSRQIELCPGYTITNSFHISFDKIVGYTEKINSTCELFNWHNK